MSTFCSWHAVISVSLYSQIMSVAVLLKCGFLLCGELRQVSGAATPTGSRAGWSGMPEACCPPGRPAACFWAYQGVPASSLDKCRYRCGIKAKAEVKSRLASECVRVVLRVLFAHLRLFCARNLRRSCRSTKGEPLVLRNSTTSLWCRRRRKPSPSLLSASSRAKNNPPVTLLAWIVTL